MIPKHSMLLYLAVQFFVAGNSQGQDGTRASCMTYGFISVLYRSEQNIGERESQCKLKHVVSRYKTESTTLFPIFSILLFFGQYLNTISGK